ncbi:hypothetical protein GCM10009784_26840 [Arthrobacter parietis]|uniref:Isocitrate dehydrogenase n=2 Tax=Arthrobacter parietis TaxID=271434 RepID=A0ABN3AZE1_9MICC
MLDHLGEDAASKSLTSAFESALADGIATPDLKGSATTAEFASEVLSRLK